MDILAISKTKLLRGAIITALYSLKGDPVDTDALRNMIRYQSYVDDGEFSFALSYLHGKNFIEIIKTENASRAFICPLGCNLYEGDIKDAGIERSL